MVSRGAGPFVPAVIQQEHGQQCGSYNTNLFFVSLIKSVGNVAWEYWDRVGDVHPSVDVQRIGRLASADVL